MTRIILAFLGLFTHVRDMQARLREAVDARIEAERQRDEALAELQAWKDTALLKQEQAADNMKAIADVLCRRFLGHPLVATTTVAEREENEEEEDPALVPLRSPYETATQRQSRVRESLQRDIDDIFASEYAATG